jgi:hypothetical protein
MTHPGAPRDVDLNEWLNGVGFQPANTKGKQIGHAAAREFIANLGVVLHELLPPGRDKSIAFTLLEDMLLRANRSLALGGGPAKQDEEYLTWLEKRIDGSPVDLPRDYRYEAEQRGESVPAETAEGVPAADWQVETVVGDVTVYSRAGGVLLQTGTSEPVELGEPAVIDDLTEHLVAARNRAWPV